MRPDQGNMRYPTETLPTYVGSRTVRRRWCPETEVTIDNTPNLIASAIRDAHVGVALSKRPAVVLERIARGGGATRWYTVAHLDQLAPLATELRPGSTVSFYFDERIASRRFDDDTVGLIFDIVQSSGEAVVGIPDADGLHVEVDFVCGLDDLTNFLGGRSPERIIVGAYPARDNDGLDAITLDLPDPDGVVRQHPH